MRKKGSILFWLGLFAVTAAFLPCVLLGENAIFTYHDQLDGELIAYLLQAKHLGDGAVLPEFLGGAAKTALTPPAPGCVLLFRVFSPLTALVLMQITGALFGYTGMYLLVKRTTGSPVAALAAGGLYGLLPFLPIYGLSQYGLPLLLWCVLRLRERESNGRTTAACLIYGAFYAVNSSLVLVGFGVLAVLAVWILTDLLRKQGRGRMAALWVVMTLLYCLSNVSLIGQLLGLGESVLSHKTEYVLAAEGFWRGFADAFLHGGQHSVDYHGGILIFSCVVLVWGALETLRKGGKPDVLCRGILGCLLCNAIFAGVAAVWNCGIGIALRNHMGALGAFQMDRFLWISPCLWYLILGYSVGFVVRHRGEKILSGLMACALMLVLGATGFTILKNSDIKSNLQKLRNPEYPLLSYSDYYALGVLDQVQSFLQDETGMSQEEYRVVSLGIDPAAALYHGFYCLDGYSNNYSLEYKHAFREVIAPALAESEYLRAYFDDWGNRCYLFGSECPGYYTIEKNGFYFQHLELDTKALRALGGDYLFSAAYIANSEELGLKLLREEPFETDDSYYRIFVYEVADE